MKKIVVGVDGSKGGAGALDFAAEEAMLRGARLVMVTAWHTPPLVLAGVVAESGFYNEVNREHREHAAAVSDEGLARAKAIAPTLECEQKVVEGQPAKVLLDESRDAFLLVLGSRGHGGFSGMLLGSVSQQVVLHAKCPVVVVPPVEA